MGLDMYCLKISKLSEDRLEALSKLDNSNCFPDDVYRFGMDIEDNPIYSDLFEVGVLSKIKTKDFALNKTRYNKSLREKGVPCHARQRGSSASPDGTSFSFFYKGEVYKADFTREEWNSLFEEQEVEIYVCQGEGVAYWRKQYDLQDLIYDLYADENDRGIENLGYHKCSEEMVELMKNHIRNTNYDLSTKDGEYLFYHEWY